MLSQLVIKGQFCWSIYITSFKCFTFCLCTFFYIDNNTMSRHFGVTLIKLQNNHRNMGIAVFKNAMPYQFFFNYACQLFSLRIVDNDKQVKKKKKIKKWVQRGKGILVKDANEKLLN